MEFKCVKVRDSSGAYTAEDGKATPARCYEAHFEPRESQHAVAGGIAFLKLWFWNVCPVQEGKLYEFNGFAYKEVEYVLVKK